MTHSRHDEAIDALARLLGPQPSDEAIQRYSAVPLLFEEPRGARSYRGRVELDSWSGTGGVRLRDVTEGHVRRIRLGWKQLHLDVVAERTHDGWQFTARVEDGDDVAHGFVLKVDAKNLLPRSGGYYHWSSKRVPRVLALSSREQQITFEELAWR